MSSALSKQYHSLIIGGKSTWDEWHMIPTSRPLVNPPTVDENYVHIPGRDGYVDFTELLADRTIYGTRTGSWEFLVHPDYAVTEPWEIKYSQLLRYLHGQFHTIVLEDDPEYFYSGRLKLSAWRSDPTWSVVTIDYVLDTYKTERQAVGAPWEWDPFNFVTGIIDPVDMTPVSGTKTITAVNGDRRIVPLIQTTIPDGSTLSATLGDVTHVLSDGANTFTDFAMSAGENVFTFTGNGSVSIQYRRGWL